MISIPVMTDETVVRRHAHAAGAAATEESADWQADAAGHAEADDYNGAAGAGPYTNPRGAPHSSSSNAHAMHSPSATTSGVAGAAVRAAFGADNLPYYLSVAVPCVNSILDVGAAPAAIASPVDVAPPEMPTLAQYCALALQLRCDRSQDQDQNFRSCFHSSRVPSISLWDYVRRFAKYSICSEECFIIAMVLMDRYVCKTKVPITLRNVHRLYITAMTLSVKLRDDSYYSNAYYASIGGVLNGELNVLELELLDTVQWFTWVERSVYDAYIQRLEELYYPAMPQHQSSPRRF